MRSGETTVRRTALGEVRGLGSAKKGTGEFIVVRVTSIALTLLLLALAIIVIACAGRPYPEVLAVLHSPLVAIILVAALLLTTVHMRLGMQVIIEDYVHAAMPKFVLLIGNWLFSWAVGLLAIFAVLRIAFGGVIA